MVAYSFQKEFAPHILSGRKSHTVRGHGKRRQARPGEHLQLYTGMRTKHCRLIGRTTCDRVEEIELHFRRRPERDWVGMGKAPVLHTAGGRDCFAFSDGFDNWAALRAFWRKHHPGIDDFYGVIIYWKPLGLEGANG